ncbi:MAG TPA: glycoside hydrolase family 88 protein [Candidatus Eisenbergiella merdavium]|uniref:Glycoside hydrolase family 88 protein n=1 Tax=Candidatus Eisenbergiella merdavium TaxID=2838551 RepID=A0A9D2NGX7_9FIRM|nr:glycoside hydrolase family 88 protein [Candidatus Eisenbergiella merdavium]
MVIRLERIEKKLDHMMKQCGDIVPWYSPDGIYRECREDFWVSGFWPGMLWIMYDLTGKESYRKKAWDWDVRIGSLFLKQSNLHHDVGFQFLTTAVLKYKITGDQDAYRMGLRAADFLAGRFNPAGRFIRAWNQEKTGWAIIDTMMNVSLLFWAADETGDPRFAHIATAHAETVLKHFMRGDGSVHHIVTFDPKTGEMTGALKGQGYAEMSSWSRGQAWAIYGMANVYRYTGDKRFLDAAKRAAQYFWMNLGEKKIPSWDFRAPGQEKERWDSSAGAIAASGMLVIAEQDELEGLLYQKCAETLIDSLTEYCTELEKTDYQGILLHGTGNKPAEEQVDVALIYGDFFYLEALAKLEGWKRRVF